jgi:nucleotide-binding universal stress UspA family protein
MLKTILVPLDGSPLAERALPYAATLARRSGADIALVRAVHATSLPGDDSRDAQMELTKQAEKHLSEAAGRLGADGVTVETHVCHEDPVHAILDAAERCEADLIVMSTHGRGGLGRMLYGSVADRVLRHATIPVLLVPSIVDHRWPSDRPLHLLVPLDGSELAEEALQSAELLAEVFESRPTLLRVIEPPTYPLYGDGYAYIPFDEDAELADARQYLKGQVARLRERGRQAEAKVAVGQSARAIAETASEQTSDVIVMATHGHGGLRRLILGSVATSTLRQTTVPLLLVRPSAMHQAEPDLSTYARAGSASGAAAATYMDPSTAQSDRSVDVRLSPVDLELIESGLKALAYAPGYDYGHVMAARALANRLRTSVCVDVGEPVTAH